MPAVGILVLMSCLIAGCDVHEFPEKGPENEPEPRPSIGVVVSFADTDWPLLTTVEYDNAPGSRAGQVGEHSLRYILNVYEDDPDSRVPSRAVVATETVVTSIPDNLPATLQSIPVQLKPGCYTVLAWVDHVNADGKGGDLYYNTSDMASISIAGLDYPGNTHHREAFRGATRFNVDAGGHVVDPSSRVNMETVPVIVERPMARYEFITTDLEEFVGSRIRMENDGSGSSMPKSLDLDDYTVRFRYTSYMPTTYNAHTDKPVNAGLGVSFAGKINRIDGKEASLGFDYVFVNGSETTVQIALDIHDTKSNRLIASTVPITVPLVRNKHTVVKGRFLTTSTGGGVGIDPGFDGSFNIEIR